MIQPIPVDETYEYILPNDKENPTIWILGHLDSITKTKIQTKMFKIKFNPTAVEKSEVLPVEEPEEIDFETIRFGLRGFKNFILRGKEVPFKTEQRQAFGKTYTVVSDDTIGMIPREVLSSLSGEILKNVAVSEEQEKNS